MKTRHQWAVLAFLAGFAGMNAQVTETKSGNIFIGKAAGKNETGNNSLYIDNTNSRTPLIWGSFNPNNRQVKLNGKTGIGDVKSFPVNNPLYANYKLFVTGGILTDEMRVKLSSGGTWPDYVFTKEYQLPTLEQVEAHINEKGHLINVPSAAEVESDGINVADMVTVQQEKIEELTLYVIAQNNINKQQATEIAELKAMVKALTEKTK
jgi:hypothetical protein